MSLNTINLQQIDTSKHHIHLYVKDRSGNYLECNDHLAKDAGFKKPDNMIGLCDFDLNFLSNAEKLELHNNDSQVIRQTKTQTFTEAVTLFDDKKVVCLSQKMPLYSKTKRVLGLIGFSLIFERKHFQAAKLFYFKDNLPTFLSLFDSYLYYLTPREIEVLYHLIRGKSTMTISQLLKISSRTAEQHLENIKLKLNLSSKSDIIEKIIDILFI